MPPGGRGFAVRAPLSPPPVELLPPLDEQPEEELPEDEPPDDDEPPPDEVVSRGVVPPELDEVPRVYPPPFTARPDGTSPSGLRVTIMIGCEP